MQLVDEDKKMLKKIILIYYTFFKTTYNKPI